MKVDLKRLHNLAQALRDRTEATQQQPRSAGRSWYRIENKGGEAEAPATIYVYDVIGEWGVSAQDFVNELRTVTAATLDLRINCEGGEVFDGLAMYESLINHKATITAYVEGIAASAASFLIMAADKIIVAPRARIMIHDAHGFAIGNARDLRETADLLDDLSDNIADIYAEHAGGTRADWRAAMRAASGGPDGTWYDATAAVKAGLADEVRGAEPAGKAPARAAMTDDEAMAWLTGQWDPAALLGTFAEVENPPEVVPLPDATAILEMFKTA